MTDKIITFSDKRKLLESEFKGHPWYIKTGFSSLDVVLEKITPGKTFIISGPTSEGKTTLCQSITQNIVNQGDKVLWFPLEGDINDFLERLKGVTVQGVIPETFVTNNIDWLELKIKEAKEQYEIKAVFVDHLHYLFDMSLAIGNTSLNLGSIARRICGIAKKYEVVFFLVAHSNDRSDSKGNFVPPRKEDIRDSKMLSREVDNIIMIWRKRDKNKSDIYQEVLLDESIVSLCKHRRTGKLKSLSVEMDSNKLFEEKFYDDSEMWEN